MIFNPRISYHRLISLVVVLASGCHIVGPELEQEGRLAPPQAIALTQHLKDGTEPSPRLTLHNNRGVLSRPAGGSESNPDSDSLSLAAVSDPSCAYEEWLELKVGGEEGECFEVDQDGIVYYLDHPLSPSLTPYSRQDRQSQPRTVYISPLSPSGRYAMLRVFGYKTDAAVIDLQQAILIDTLNPLSFLPLWVEWSHREDYGFILHADDGGGFDSIERIDVRDGTFQYWVALDLLDSSALGNTDTEPYYRLDEQTFSISPDDQTFSIQVNLYENRSATAVQQQVIVEVNIETMETIPSSLL